MVGRASSTDLQQDPEDGRRSNGPFHGDRLVPGSRSIVQRHLPELLSIRPMPLRRQDVKKSFLQGYTIEIFGSVASLIRGFYNDGIPSSPCFKRYQ